MYIRYYAAISGGSDLIINGNGAVGGFGDG